MCWGHYYDTTAVLLHLKATRPDSSRTGPNALLEVRRSFCPPVGVKTPKVYHPYLGVKISIRSIIRIPETLGAKTSDLPRLYGAKITAYLPILRVKKKRHHSTNYRGKFMRLSPDFWGSKQPPIPRP